MRDLTQEERFRLREILRHKVDFREMRTPEEYHQYFFYYYWDLEHKGVYEPLWIVTRDNCDLGTAVQIFWQANPIEHAGYKDRGEIEEDFRGEFDLLQTIVARYRAGAYQNQNFRFDPTDDDGGEPHHSHDKFHFATARDASGELFFRNQRSNWTSTLEGVDFQWDFPAEFARATPGDAVKLEALFKVEVQNSLPAEMRRIQLGIDAGYRVLRRNLGDLITPESAPNDIVACIEGLVREYLDGNPRDIRHSSIMELDWVWADQLRRAYGWEWLTLDREGGRALGMFSPDRRMAAMMMTVVCGVVFSRGDASAITSLFRGLADCSRWQDFQEALENRWLTLV